MLKRKFSCSETKAGCETRSQLLLQFHETEFLIRRVHVSVECLGSHYLSSHAASLAKPV